ncbi:hypothetical protein EYF80_030648 [Liparis tanakae]|uniref:Uncharacterized protein n=1 Tax=Liparis tanakae TaxID=230148 RepID=A0A4Z2H2S2_9TELE|nr:hypothetical protein EYF80_030648 [Liparis tanakae]
MMQMWPTPRAGPRLVDGPTCGRTRPSGRGDLRPPINRRRPSFTRGPDVHRPVRCDVSSGRQGSQPRAPTSSSPELSVVTM